MSFRSGCRIVLCAVATLAATRFDIAQVCTRHTYLGNQPDEGTPGWHSEAQGLAHDDDFWFVSHNPTVLVAPSTFARVPVLWRIPVTHDLADGVSCGTGGVSCSSAAAGVLFSLGYDHYGDPDFFTYAGRGYVLMPIENGSPGAGFAVFRADASLQFLAFATLPTGTQTHSSWVAADASGILVSSDFSSVGRFNRFSVDWAAFVASDEQTLSLTALPPMPLLDEAGAPLELDGAQGGEYSDDGQLLYFSDLSGVYVFRTRPGTDAECGAAGHGCTIARRVESSHNGPGGFAYEFDTGNDEEPEGLTFWDLDADGRAPGLGGQLHVVLLDNEFFGDEVYVKHYSLAFEDPDAPTLTCPGPATAECASPAGVAAASAALQSFFAGASASDTCDETPTIGNDAPAFFPLGTSAVTFTARDDAGNAASCASNVTVVDTTPPSITCPPSATVPTAPGTCSATVNPGTPTVVDVCSATSGGVRSDSLPLGAPYPKGTTAITWTATDRGGSARSCVQTVRVEDRQPPIVNLISPAHDVTSLPPLTIPIEVRFTTQENCTAIAHEVVKLEGCPIIDGSVVGDRDGFLSDERMQINKPALCQFMTRCGFTTLVAPRIQVESTDASGNTGMAQRIIRARLLKTEVCAR